MGITVKDLVMLHQEAIKSMSNIIINTQEIIADQQVRIMELERCVKQLQELVSKNEEP